MRSLLAKQKVVRLGVGTKRRVLWDTAVVVVVAEDGHGMRDDDRREVCSRVERADQVVVVDYPMRMQNQDQEK